MYKSKRQYIDILCQRIPKIWLATKYFLGYNSCCQGIPEKSNKLNRINFVVGFESYLLAIVDDNCP